MADHDRTGPEYRYLDWYATANTHYVDYGTKDILVLHYGIWPWRRVLNGACISIYNLLENIAWQTHRPEARGPLKSGAWGGRPTCHPQMPPLQQTNPKLPRIRFKSERTKCPDKPQVVAFIKWDCTGYVIVKSMSLAYIIQTRVWIPSHGRNEWLLKRQRNSIIPAQCNTNVNQFNYTVTQLSVKWKGFFI